MDIESRVTKEVEKLKLPKKFKAIVRPYSKVYPLDKEQKNSYNVLISIGSKRKDPTEDVSCSYLDFWYNKDKMRIEEINLDLNKKMRGFGYGKKLVKIMEKLGRYLKCTEVRINNNINPSFWKHMGYKENEKYWVKPLKKR